MTERCVAILGWRDEPTDAVEEYCQYLSEGLKDCGIQLEQIRVPWPEVGWHAAMQHLPETTRDLQKTWFLLQYTALGWSRRGFPLTCIGSHSRSKGKWWALRNCIPRYLSIFWESAE